MSILWLYIELKIIYLLLGWIGWRWLFWVSLLITIGLLWLRAEANRRLHG